jgi:hypothetical protein
MQTMDKTILHHSSTAMITMSTVQEQTQTDSEFLLSLYSEDTSDEYDEQTQLEFDDASF